MMPWITQDARPKIVVAISDQDSQADIHAVRPDAVELRLDLCSSQESGYLYKQVAMRKELGLPLILTCRDDLAEGATQVMDLKRKMAILKELMPMADAVDVEFRCPARDDLMQLCRENEVKTIVSRHEFEQMLSAEELDEYVESVQDSQGDVAKIACLIESQADLKTMTSFLLRHKSGLPVVPLGLGLMGPVSRVMFPMLGAMFTYSFVHSPKAPGQLGIKDLKQNFSRLWPGYTEFLIDQEHNGS
jgi:3-dehydroquinate dehydratase-1